jgi:hypothetical protein
LLPFALELKLSTHSNIAPLESKLQIHETLYTIQLPLSQHRFSPKRFRVDLYRGTRSREATAKEKEMQITRR